MKKRLKIGDTSYTYFSIKNVIGPKVSTMPYCKRILLENLMRNQEKSGIETASILRWAYNEKIEEIPFYPARILMQDFTGVPAIVDLASARDSMENSYSLGSRVDPQIPVDVVIDHSVTIECSGEKGSLSCNIEKEYKQNQERYELFKWAQSTFENVTIIPPSSGICHQVNVEHLAQIVREDGEYLFPDTLLGTDSHTTMINGLGVLGWGVGGIEAEATMLGLPYSIPTIEVVGVRLTGKIPPSCTSTDMVLYITEFLRKVKVVGKFVEFFGPGYESLDIADRATIANMCPEYGATCGYFPIDQKSIDYLSFTGRKGCAERTQAYAKANNLFYQSSDIIDYDTVVEFNLDSIELSVAGPSRPQDRVRVADVPSLGISQFSSKDPKKSLHGGDIVIAAITSCTNTSNPKVMIGAALLAKKAIEKGLTVKPWVKTSFAPGSKVVTHYLQESKLLPYLEQLGFYVDAYGCTTCIGNSGPLLPIGQKAAQEGVPLVAILSGNRNFTGRIHQSVKGAFLASPLLVVAYALAGNIQADLLNQPIDKGVYLKDIWPTHQEIEDIERAFITTNLYTQVYRTIKDGDQKWKELSPNFTWKKDSTYIAKVPFFEDLNKKEREIEPIKGARVLALFEDSITTDHISPAGNIDANYPAGTFLLDKGVSIDQFNSYGSRRGNHEVMVRGTFANIRLQNLLAGKKEGGLTTKFPENKIDYIYNVAMAYQKEKRDLIIIAGKEYGTGSSRDWAAKGTALLGVKAVIAQSFERIHRSNLIGMGIIPLQFIESQNKDTLEISGGESFDINLPSKLAPKQEISVTMYDNGKKRTFSLLSRLDTESEITYYLNNGVLRYALNLLI
jgi:aconitate hydratase